jgi:hypothetical protein
MGLFLAAHKPPFRRGPSFAPRGRRPDSSPNGASRLRDSAGFQPVFAAPRRTRAPVPGHVCCTTALGRSATKRLGRSGFLERPDPAGRCAPEVRYRPRGSSPTASGARRGDRTRGPRDGRRDRPRSPGSRTKRGCRRRRRIGPRDPAVLGDELPSHVQTDTGAGAFLAQDVLARRERLPKPSTRSGGAIPRRDRSPRPPRPRAS